MVRINNADDELVKQFCNECETIENGSDESATYHTARLDLFLDIFHQAEIDNCTSVCAALLRAAHRLVGKKEYNKIRNEIVVLCDDLSNNKV